MKFSLAFCIICATFPLLCSSALPTEIGYPEDDGNKQTVSEFIHRNLVYNQQFRDSLIIDYISHGKVPASLRHWVSIKESLVDADGNTHNVEMFVAPDVVAIGSDDDYLRVPMLPMTAQQIADMCNAILPTRKISNLIHKHSKVQLVPHPMTPDSTMITMRIFAKHDSIVKSQMSECGAKIGDFIAGHKKDVVITNRIDSLPDRVHIYGWHYPDGKNIQPLYSGHTLPHVDYSHGIRLISRRIIVDGKEWDIVDLLHHPLLYALVSDEPGVMNKCSY